MKLRAREKTLLGLLLLIAGIQGVRLFSDSLGGGGLKLAALRKSAARQAAEGMRAGSVAELNIAVLDAKAGTTEVGRDPFRFGRARPVAREAPPPLPPGRTTHEISQQRAAERSGSEARPPDIDLSFLGSFGSPDRKIAVFSDGESIINALVGETLQDDFIVHKIGYESVDLRFVDFPDHPPERLAVGATGRNAR